MSRAAEGTAAPVIGEGAQVGEGVRFGSFVVVHPGTVIGDGCELQDHVVLGKPPRLAPHSSAGGGEELEPLVLDPGVAVCAGAVAFRGARGGTAATRAGQA